MFALPGVAMAQVLLYNDGGIVKIDPGAVLVVEGGVTNTSTGTINNDGTLEIQGNLVNSGTWDNAQPNTLRFTGTTASTVTPGTAQFYDLVIQKSGVNVIMAGNMTVTNSINFNASSASRIETGNFTLILNAATTVTGQDADEYVATTGTGVVQKNMTANGTFAFPVGDATNYSPISSTWTGTAYGSANLKVRANNLTHPNKPADATDFISRYWDVDASGITGYGNSLTGTYINTAEDVTGTASLVKGASYSASTWSHAGAAQATATVTGTVTAASTDFTGMNFFGKIDFMAFLQGPYSSSNQNMSTSLNGAGYIPLTSPYTDAPATVTSIPANVTDWVKIEFRDPSNPATIIGKASAFIKNTGNIVGLDGTALPRVKDGNPSSVVAIFHRNHLPFRTNVGIDVVNTSLEDFTITNAKLFDNASGNPPLNTIGSRLVMWPCDATGTTYLVNSTDYNFVRSQAANTPTGYLRADVNMNGAVNSTDVNLTKSISSSPKSADL